VTAPELIFEEPPALQCAGRPAGKTPLGLWLAELRNHPGVWAKYPEQVSGGVPTRIRQGNYGVAAGEFEVTVRNAGKRCDLYVRYVGGA
jgi:hypothetical protein